MIHLVLYQPDIPQNLGALLRLSACMGATIHIIEPCGFPLDDAKMRRVGMDYMHKARYVRHLNWQAFLGYRKSEDELCVASHGEPLAAWVRPKAVEGKEPPSRLFLLETDGTTRYTDMRYQPSDYIVLGRESAGTPAELYTQMDATLTIPMVEGMRSLNVAMSAGMITAEACRQLDWKFA
jgi:tRNA (cytidine/uridine-2'-O-)-methyltransferase